MEMTEKPIPSLDEFSLLALQVKSNGGHIIFSWEESWEKDNGATTWVEEKSVKAPRIINEQIFTLLDRMTQILAKQAGVDVEELNLTNIKFFERSDSVKLYDLGVKFKLAGEKETRATSRITMQDLAHKSTIEYSEIEGLITEIEANAYSFCVLGMHFEETSDAIEIENDGTVNFEG